MVSSVGWVTPALEMVGFHSGYGVPLWMVTHSGCAPLVNTVPKMLDQLCKMNDGAAIRRIVVIGVGVARAYSGETPATAQCSRN
jgi:hypothetical protein